MLPEGLPYHKLKMHGLSGDDDDDDDDDDNDELFLRYD